LIGSRRYRRALTLGTAAAVEHEWLVKSLPINSLIDVGANKGQFSLLVREHHPRSRVYAIEPLSEAADLYAALFEGTEDITLFRCAAGSRSNSLTINISARADSSSILPITEAQENAFPGTALVGSRIVSVEPLDHLIDAAEVNTPLLIKLDVQGYELEALKGMPQLLARASYIYLEVSFETLYAHQPLASDVIAWLSSNGFNLALVNAVTHSKAGVPVQADVLFTRQERSSHG